MDTFYAGAILTALFVGLVFSRVSATVLFLMAAIACLLARLIEPMSSSESQMRAGDSHAAIAPLRWSVCLAAAPRGASIRQVGTLQCGLQPFLDPPRPFE